MSQLIVDIPVTHISPVHSVSPVIRETTQSKDHNVRRNSEVVTPIYHRASTSSCHDLCKYGKTPESQTKGKQSILRRSAKAALSEVGDPVAKHETPIEEREKKPVVRPKPTSPEVKTITELPSPNSIKRECKSITREVSSPSKKIDVKPRILVGKVASPPKDAIILPKPAVSSPNVSSPSTKIVVPAKPGISLKQKVVKTRLSSSPLNSPQSLSSGRKANVMVVNNTVSTKIVEKKSLSSPRCSLSPKPFVPRFATSNINKPKTFASSLKNQSKDRNAEPNEQKTEKLREKTLYVIEPKPENKSLSLPVDLSPISNSSEKASSSSTCYVCVEPGSARSVILFRCDYYHLYTIPICIKQQNNKGKKEEHVLINNVIEAIASKLVETRKSKVKPLVGAFETVISLHETKSSSATTD
ncbi:hypothetical protein MKX01_024497 [Papaver californicum]|nr:hypothetical protein MKX01_024497 [Papaver californicum]